MKKLFAKFLWQQFKTYFFIESGKDVINLTPWFRVTIFGIEVARLDYTTHEILNWRRRP